MSMRPFLSVMAFATLAACAGTGAVGPTEEAAPAGPVASSPSTVFGLTADQLPQVTTTGPALDLDWATRYRSDVPYVNGSALSIPVYSGPDGQDRIARLPPQNGGFLDACTVEIAACSITFGEDRRRGWVLMDQMIPLTSQPET